MRCPAMSRSTGLMRHVAPCRERPQKISLAIQVLNNIWGFAAVGSILMQGGTRNCCFCHICMKVDEKQLPDLCQRNTCHNGYSQRSLWQLGQFIFLLLFIVWISEILFCFTCFTIGSHVQSKIAEMTCLQKKNIIPLSCHRNNWWGN